MAKWDKRDSIVPLQYFFVDNRSDDGYMTVGPRISGSEFDVQTVCGTDGKLIGSKEVVRKAKSH